MLASTSGRTKIDWLALFHQ